MSCEIRIGKTATQDSLHSKPSSLKTDEDWDQLLAKEQQEDQNGVDSSSTTEMQRADVSPSGVGQGDEERTLMSPRRTVKEFVQHSTPSSPSEILRLTRRYVAPGDREDDTRVEEAARFEKELGDWVRHLSFEV